MARETGLSDSLNIGLSAQPYMDEEKISHMEELFSLLKKGESIMGSQ